MKFVATLLAFRSDHGVHILASFKSCRCPWMLAVDVIDLDYVAFVKCRFLLHCINPFVPCQGFQSPYVPVSLR